MSRTADTLPPSGTPSPRLRVNSQPAAGWLVQTLSGVAAGLCVAVVAGLAARFHWTLELLTHFRVHLIVALLIIAVVLLVCRQRTRGFLTLLVPLVFAPSVLPLYLPAASPPPGAATWRLVAVNLRGDNHRHDKLRETLSQLQPDVLICLEVRDHWAEVLAELTATYPLRLVEPQPGNFGVALFSRFPLRKARLELLSNRNPALRAIVQLPDGSTCTLLGVHPVPPMSGGLARLRDGQLGRLAELVNDSPPPVIVAGDFNTTSWSPAFVDFVSATGLQDTRKGFGVQPTWHPLGWTAVGIPIDHALATAALLVARRFVGPDVGSDHRPIVVDFCLAP